MSMLISYSIQLLLIALLDFRYRFPAMSLNFGDAVGLMIFLSTYFTYFFIKLRCHSLYYFLSFLHNNLYFSLYYP